jgi:hypothetical protein
MTHSEEDEDSKMLRLKRIDEKLYDDILELESDIMIEMNKKMGELTKVKDLSLAYKRPESRKLLTKIKNKYKKKSTSKK